MHSISHAHTIYFATQPTLIYATDICYPGCGDFTTVYDNNEFEDIVMKYVPCNSTQCVVTVIAQSDQCVLCSIPLTRQLRVLQAIPLQSSTITFEIQSTIPLNEEEVTSNLNSNIANVNNETSTVNPPFEIKSNFVSTTSQPTTQPTTPLPTPRPSQGSKSGKSGGGKSSKGPKGKFSS